MDLYTSLSEMNGAVFIPHQWNLILILLSGRKNRSLVESRIESNPNIEYVGDKFITILILEDGNIYDVHVTNTDVDEVQL